MIVDDELLIELDPAGFAPAAAKEVLAIAVDEHGVRHAISPTATRTLCNRADDALDVHGDDGDGPDCIACATTARAWDRIDRSAPSSWFRSHERAA